MKIKISQTGYVHTNNQRFKNFLKENAGDWLEVDTRYLFHNQYSTKEFRIYDSMIDEVIDDERKGKGRCSDCGEIVSMKNPHLAHAIPNCEHNVIPFTEENTYFLRHPRRIKVKKLEGKKFGSYEFQSYPELNLYRIRNARQTIDFHYDKYNRRFYEHSSIDYSEKSWLPVPTQVQRSLVKYIIGEG